MKKLRSRSFRPSIESLEHRSVPATFAVSTFADTVNPLDGVLSLREAITAANATPGADTIRLPAGVYKITLAGADNANLRGDFDVTDSLTLAGNGAGVTFLEANTPFPGILRERLFDVLGPVNVTFLDLTMRNAGNDQSFGGAVQAISANVTLQNVNVTGMRALKGGAINAETGNVTLIRSTLSNNVSQGNGGAINATSGNVSINSSTVARNSAADDGGGIFAGNGTVTVATNSSVRLNHAGQSFVGGNAGAGGGVFAKTVVLTNSTVSGNFTLAAANNVNDAPGGGIYATGSIIVTNGTVSGNRTPGKGGGLSAFDTVTMTNGTVSGNQAGLQGGGIEAATLTLLNSTVSGNSAHGGGGLAGAFATLTTSTVRDNISSERGGGIAVGTTNLIRSTVSGNSASTDGGGIHTFIANLTNSTVSGNSAGVGGSGSGGGISTHGGTILNSTIVENVATGEGGGVLATVFEAIPPLQVKNTIIANNFALGFGPDVRGTFVSQGNNLIGVVDGSTGFGAAGDQLGTADDPIDPLLAPLANNGGPTQTHALLAGSTAIDRGNNAGAPATDQRGVARPRDGDANGSLIVDIGAFEV